MIIKANFSTNKTMSSPILRQIDFPNAFTLTGLMLSFISVIFALQGQFYAAIICMIYAGFTDMLDGFVARQTKRTELQSEVGKQLDSIVDVCSFGFAPAIFAYSFGLHDPISISVLIFYIGMNALRLAYFNSTGLSQAGEEKYFTGLPVTYAAMFIPLTFTASFVLSGQTMKLVINGLYLFLAIAMVTDFKMIKIRGIWYGIFTLGALFLSAVYGWAIAVGI